MVPYTGATIDLKVDVTIDTGQSVHNVPVCLCTHAHTVHVEGDGEDRNGCLAAVYYSHALWQERSSTCNTDGARARHDIRWQRAANSL